MKKLWGNLAASAVSLLIVLIILEAVFRILFPFGPAFPKSAYVEHPTLGYSLAPNQDFTIQDTDFIYKVTTNSKGFRDEEEVLDAKKRIVIVGDSYAFGTGVENDETFASKIENENIQAFNLGVGGYGTVQEVRMAREQLGLDPDVVVLQFFNGNDVQDSLGLRKMAVKDGRLVYADTASNFGAMRKLQAWMIENSRFLSFAYLRTRNLIGVFKYTFDKKEQLYRLSFSLEDYSEEINGRFEVIDSAFQDLEALSKENGFKVIVLIIPNDYEVDQEKFDKLLSVMGLDKEGYSQEKMGNVVASLAEKHGFQAIDMRAAFTAGDYFPHDGHINEKGHEKVAEALGEAI